MAPALVIPLLETLTPWPDTTAPTVLDLLGIIVAIPVAISAVVAVAVMGPAWFRRHSSDLAVRE
ncbi:MAG: hypothetical protein ACK5LS_13150 [Propioniciclava sp.]